MLVSGGKILAIDKVYHDNTLSGDGVNKPLGVDPSQLGNNVIVSAGMNTTVDTYTGENNVITYVINAKTSGAATTEVKGDTRTGIKSEWIEDGSYWLISYIGEQGNIYSAGPNIGIYQENGQWKISASQPDIDALSALIASTYLSATTFDVYSADIVKQFTATSAWANDTFQPKGEYLSASEHFLSANALDTLSGKWNEVSAKADTTAVNKQFENTSAWANSTFQPIGEYLSASEKFLSANALDDVSAAWNAHSALSAAKQDALTEAQLSAISSVSSLYNTEVVAGKNVSVESQTANNTVTYTISADDVMISGNNGISAEFDEDTKQWNVGLSATNSYACYVAPMTGDGTTYNVDEYEQVYNAGSEITLGNGTIDIAGQGLWHITVNATIENNATDDNYYNTTLSFGTNEATIQFDNSYQHTETINLDFDKLISDDTTYSNAPIVTDAPENATVHITNISIHKVATGITYMEGSTTYVGGKAIKIGDNNDINFVPGSGLQAGYDGADVKLGDALGFDANSAIEVLPGSGLYIDDKQKLSLRLGKGLAFSGNGDVIAIETDGDVNEVVETVQALQKELDGKLTTNMNISDAKSVGNPWAGDSNLNNLAASMFTIPLQHNLTTASTISFITTQDLGQSDQAPLMIGILEYNFDYFVSANNELGVSSRSQTKWIADTGPIWADGDDCYDIYGKNPATDGAGRYTYYLKNLTTVISSYVEDHDGKKYYNEVGPCMRSDRAYYLALFAHNPNNYKWFLSDDGFNTNTIHNTDPAISFRVVGCTYYNNETDPTGVGIDDTFIDNVRNGTQQFSMSGLPWWGSNRGYNDIDKIQRPYVMIRNPRM